MYMLELHNHKLEISNEDHIYHQLRQEFYEFALSCSREYEEQYKKNYINLDDVIKRAYKDAMFLIGRGIEYSVEKLISYSVLEVDKDSFLENYYDKITFFEDAYGGIEEKYFGILENSQMIDEYRYQRRQSRGKIIGGGFGVSGAVKGMATAGAFNMATGAIHATFNGLGSMGTKVGNAIKKSNIYKDTDTKIQIQRTHSFKGFLMRFFICIKM